jgi:hypothetical protein
MILLIGNKTSVKGYHTQECRSTVLNQPLKCVNKKAWRGFGYYFWLEEEYAHYWGQDAKIKNDSESYDIYIADLNIENCINTVFDEEGYVFFIIKIEEAIQQYKNRKIPITLENVNRYLAEKVWPKLGISGIIYDDKPTNPRNKNRIYSEIPDLYYKKRIQVVIFDSKKICNFELYLKSQNINLKIR